MSIVCTWGTGRSNKVLPLLLQESTNVVFATFTSGRYKYMTRTKPYEELII